MYNLSATVLKTNKDQKADNKNSSNPPNQKSRKRWKSFDISLLQNENTSTSKRLIYNEPIKFWGPDDSTINNTVAYLSSSNSADDDDNETDQNDYYDQYDYDGDEEQSTATEDSASKNNEEYFNASSKSDDDSTDNEQEYDRIARILDEHLVQSNIPFSSWMPLRIQFVILPPDFHYINIYTLPMLKTIRHYFSSCSLQNQISCSILDFYLKN